MKHFKSTTTLLALDSLSVYRGLLEDPVLSRLRALLIGLDPARIELRETINLYNAVYYELAKTGGLSLKSYLIEQILYDENPFSFKMQAIQETDSENVLDYAVVNDLKALQLVAELDSVQIKNAIIEVIDKLYQINVETLPDWIRDDLPATDPRHIAQIKEKLSFSNHWDTCLDDLKEFHKTYGCGLFARYNAFVWEKSGGQGFLKGIDNPDQVTLAELVEYRTEQSRVIENTLHFLKGFPANNVLLYGDRGTGKSSTVKAILNEYHTQGLRMLEVPKAYLADFPLIIRHLKNRAQKFILFVDDLVFGDNEENYTSLKAVLEGGLESKTPNILIYATSNRRHLVKEYFAERAGLQSGNHDEEVHAGDSMQEKLSLADRFGINVVFSSPDQNQYLKIVSGIAAQRNLNISQDQLHKEALQWALSYNGRSARTARQFVDWLEGRLNDPMFSQ